MSYHLQLNLCMFIWDGSCWPWQYLCISILQWRPENTCSIMHTTAPLSSSPYQRPCVSAVSYITHTSSNGRHLLPRFESTLTEEWSVRWVCVRACVCVCERRCVHKETRNKRQLRMSLLVFICAYTYLYYPIQCSIRGHSCLWLVCVHWWGESAAVPCFGVACAVFTADYMGPQLRTDSSFTGVCLIFVPLIVCMCFLLTAGRGII